jgi:hypothetical protein
MKRLLRFLGWVIFVGALLAIGGMIYSTQSGYTTWYLRVNGQVTVDGRKTTGYLHANTQRTLLLLTRTDDSRRQTYLIPVDGKKIFDCGGWHPIRFLPMAVGDLNPPCSVFTDPAPVTDAPIDSTLIRGRRSVEFSTASGKKIKAEW